MADLHPSGRNRSRARTVGIAIGTVCFVLERLGRLGSTWPGPFVGLGDVEGFSIAGCAIRTRKLSATIDAAQPQLDGCLLPTDTCRFRPPAAPISGDERSRRSRRTGYRLARL